jgi:hypothetical protein
LELSAESAAFHAASTGLPSIRLRSSVGLRAEGGAAFASFRLKEGESAYFILGDAQDEPVNELIPFVRGELQRTCAYWKQWAGKSVYEGRWRESVTRSALTLKLLTSAEHGSLVAALPSACPSSLAAAATGTIAIHGYATHLSLSTPSIVWAISKRVDNSFIG